MREFIVNLKNGTRLVFDEPCNKVEYNNANLCVFLHENEDKTFETLALVSYDNIESIVARELVKYETDI